MKRRGTFRLVFVSVLIFLYIPAWAAEPATKKAEKLDAVLWIGGHSHEFEAFAKIMVDDLKKRIPVEIRVVRDGGFLDSPEAGSLDSPEAGRLDLILMNHCFGSAKGVLSESQKKKLLATVSGGVGVVAVHASYYSFPEWDECHDFFGARFIKHGSTQVYLTVAVTDKRHPITKGLADSFEVQSELYQSTPLAAGCHVLARAKEKGTAAEYPSVWTKSYNKGRVVTILPAHWPKAYEVDQFQQLIAQSALWAAKRPQHTPTQQENP